MSYIPKSNINYCLYWCGTSDVYMLCAFALFKWSPCICMCLYYIILAVASFIAKLVYTQLLKVYLDKVDPLASPMLY